MVKMHDDVDLAEGGEKGNGPARARATPRVPTFVRSTSERHDVRAPDFMRARSGGGAGPSPRPSSSKGAPASPDTRSAATSREAAANDAPRAAERPAPTPPVTQANPASTFVASAASTTTTTAAPPVQPSAPLPVSENAMNAGARADGAKGAANAAPPAAKQVSAEKTTTAANDAGAATEDAHVFDRLRDAVLMLRHASASLAEQARSDALEIGIEIARQIVRQELTTNVEPMMRFVKEAIRQAGDARVVRVRLSPEDARRMSGYESEFRTSALSASHVEIVEDDTLSRGDVEVDTDFGRIDARVSRRLDELQRTVEDTWQKTRATPGTE